MYFRLWDIECGACLRVLEGHEELVRCIRFDTKRIVSGAYDGKIKVWDLVAALDPRAASNTLCLNTLVVSHPLRHFRFCLTCVMNPCRNTLVASFVCNSMSSRL